MSSKVVHLSNEAHSKAKAFCKARGLKMSDWVAALINTAIENDGKVPTASEAAPGKNAELTASPPAANSDAPRSESGSKRSSTRTKPPQNVTTAKTSSGKVRAMVPKKKVLPQAEEPPPKNSEEDVPPWAAPPFWAQR